MAPKPGTGTCRSANGSVLTIVRALNVLLIVSGTRVRRRVRISRTPLPLDRLASNRIEGRTHR
jgi:hypothetical protein